MRTHAEINVLPTPKDLFLNAAEGFYKLGQDAIKEKGVFYVVLSGGETAKHFFDAIVSIDKEQMNWGRVHFFFADERYLPIDDSENNYNNAHIHLFSHINIADNQIHRIQTEYDKPEDSALAYEAILRSYFDFSDEHSLSFDVVYLGLGANGHTGSLMPHSTIVDQAINNSLSGEARHVVASLWDPLTQTTRVTMMPSALNHSKTIIFLVTEEQKAHAVHEVLEGPYSPADYPAQLIDCEQGKTVWSLDRLAASKLINLNLE